MLREGDSGEQVRAVQQSLAERGYKIAVDGIFGPGTETAVREFQRSCNLLPDGIVGPNTQAHLDRPPSEKSLSRSDIEQAARTLGVSVAAVFAVTEVESRGSGFLPSGDPTILFERHIMRRRLDMRGIDTQPWEERYPNIVNRSPGGYQGGQREHKRLSIAKAIDTESAIESASWGLFQILGMHWERLGYESAADFQDAMHRSEADHLDCFVRFIKADPTLYRALKDLDWHTFARLYNGPNYASHNYHERMASAYDRHRTG